MYEMPGGLSKEQFKKDPKQAVNLYDETETDSLLARLSGFWDITENAAISFTAGLSSRDTSTDIISWFSFTDTSLDSVTVSPSVSVDFPGIMYGMSLTSGFDYYSDSIEVKRYSDLNRATRTFSGDGEKSSLGLYSRGEVFLLDQLVFTLSGRYDSALYSFDFGPDKDSKTHDSFVWGSGLNYMIGQSGKVYLKYEKIFRYPFLDEQIVYSGYGSDGFTKNLEPEKGYSLDAGFQLGAGKYLAIGINGFYMIMDDEIAYNSLTLQSENYRKTIRYGAESFAALKPLDSFTITGTYNFTIAEFARGDEKDNDIPIVPGHRFSIVPEVIVFNIARIYSEIIYSGSYYRGGDTANALDKIDGYLLLNAGAEITKKTGNADISIYGKIKNIADKEYAQLVYYNDFSDTSAYYPGNGREMEFGISCSY
jgi:iron complex outermembrane receptor protein